jgi:HEAT repeat protein
MEQAIAKLSLEATKPENLSEELAIQRRNLYSNLLSTKRFAIKYLGEFEDQDSFPIIEKMVSASFRRYYYGSPDPLIDQETLRDAFTSLFKINPAQACPLLLQGLEQGFYGDYYLVRERIVNLLGSDVYSSPNEKLVNQMINQINDSSWGVRQAVCRVLGKWGKSKALDQVGRLLNDPQLQVRIAAAEAFERLSESQSKKQEESVAVVKDIELSTEQIVALAEKIAAEFNLEELQNLCFKLNVPYDELESRGKQGKVRELIEYCQRHGKIRDLIVRIDNLRPHKKTFLDRVKSFVQ